MISYEWSKSLTEIGALPRLDLLLGSSDRGMKGNVRPKWIFAKYSSMLKVMFEFKLCEM